MVSPHVIFLHRPNVHMQLFSVDLVCENACAHISCIKSLEHVCFAIQALFSLSCCLLNCMYRAFLSMTVLSASFCFGAVAMLVWYFCFLVWCLRVFCWCSCMVGISAITAAMSSTTVTTSCGFFFNFPTGASLSWACDSFACAWYVSCLWWRCLSEVAVSQ